MSNLFTDVSVYSQRMEHLEQGVVDAIRKAKDPAWLMPEEELRMLYGQIIELGRTDTSDATFNSRMTSLLLLGAYLRHDEATISALTLELHKELHGKRAAATCGEAYLFLKYRPCPLLDTQRLRCMCYHLLREWKHDIAANESRYEEFMRVVARRQSTLAPDTLEWLQLEEISADYKTQSTDRRAYKLVCKE